MKKLSLLALLVIALTAVAGDFPLSTLPLPTSS
jgi:hypothetical protein